MKLTIFGCGFVGITSGTLLSRHHDVTGYDVDVARVSALQRGELPFMEPGLAGRLKAAVAESRLRFTTDPVAALERADAVLVSVGTPSLPDGRADLSAVIGAAAAIEQHGHARPLVVLRSTSPVGTADKVQVLLGEAFTVVVNPEFLAEGRACADFLAPDRIVVGVGSLAEHRLGRTVGDRGHAPAGAPARALEVMHKIYDPLMLPQGVPWVVTDRRSAELVKYAANAMLALRISFINDFAALADEVGADVRAIARGMGLDRRIGPQFLEAGIGWGGSCFGKDLSALVRLGADHDVRMHGAIAALDRNDEQRRNLVAELAHEARDLPLDAHLVVLGRAFKPGTSDERDSPGLSIAEDLRDDFGSVDVIDPPFDEAKMELLRQADVVVVATAWAEFVGARWLDRLRRGTLVVDARNALTHAAVEARGLRYRGIGLGGSIVAAAAAVGLQRAAQAGPLVEEHQQQGGEFHGHEEEGDHGGRVPPPRSEV